MKKIHILIINTILFVMLIAASVYANDEQNKDLCIICENGLFGVMDINGNVIVKPQYANISPFYDGIAVAEDINGKWGYINSLGEEFISCRFIEAYPFKNNIAVVRERDWNPDSIYGPYIYIDKTGNKIINEEFLEASDFDGNFAKVHLTNGYGEAIIDKFGNRKIRKSGLDLKGKDILFESLNDRQIYIGSTNFKFKKLGEYDYARLTDYGTIIVQKGYKRGVIDKNGNVIVDIAYDIIDQISENCFIALNNKKYGVVSSDNHIQVDLIYDDIEIYKDEYFIVCKDDKYGVIYKNKAVVDIDYDKISIIADKFLLLEKENNKIIADIKNGVLKKKNIHLPDFDWVFSSFTDPDICYIVKNENDKELLGIVDFKNNVFIEPQYNNIIDNRNGIYTCIDFYDNSICIKSNNQIINKQ